jgi:tRNA (adenine57-N1/adenine58-N1)-methyltransferase catalytic subunit
VTVPLRRRRPAKGAYGTGPEDRPDAGEPEVAESGAIVTNVTDPVRRSGVGQEWTEQDLGERLVGERKMRRLRRSLP